MLNNLSKYLTEKSAIYYNEHIASNNPNNNPNNNNPDNNPDNPDNNPDNPIY